MYAYVTDLTDRNDGTYLLSYHFADKKAAKKAKFDLESLCEMSSMINEYVVTFGIDNPIDYGYDPTVLHVIQRGKVCLF